MNTCGIAKRKISLCAFSTATCNLTFTKKVFSCMEGNNVLLKIHILSRQVVLELASLRNYLYTFASYRSCVG